MMPWGIDQTFGGDLDPFDSGALLVTRCLGEPDCAEAYAARVLEVLETFEDLDLGGRARDIQAQIRDAVERDPRKEYANQDWEWVIGDIPNWVAWRPGRYRELLDWHGF